MSRPAGNPTTFGKWLLLAAVAAAGLATSGCLSRWGAYGADFGEPTGKPGVPLGQRGSYIETLNAAEAAKAEANKASAKGAKDAAKAAANDAGLPPPDAK